MARALPRSTAHAFRLSVSIGFGPFRSWRTRKNACCEAIRGSLVRRPITNAMATSTMSCSRADTRWTPTATPSIFTTELPIARLPWLEPACALCSIGWMPMEVANAGIELRSCETAAADFSSLHFGCRHRQRSAVFTIKKRTYQVCLNCGQEFEYSWATDALHTSSVAVRLTADPVCSSVRW